MYNITSLTNEQKQLLIDSMELAQRSGMAGSGGVEFEKMFDLIVDSETVNVSIDKRKQAQETVLKTFELLGELNKSTLDNQVKIGKAMEKCHEIIKTYEAVKEAEIWKNKVMSLPKEEFKTEIICEFIEDVSRERHFRYKKEGMNKSKIFTLIGIEDRSCSQTVDENGFYRVYEFKNNLDNERTFLLKSDIERLFEEVILEEKWVGTYDPEG